MQQIEDAANMSDAGGGRDRSPLRRRLQQLAPWLTCDRAGCAFGTRRPERLARHPQFHAEDDDGDECYRCPLQCVAEFETLAEAIRHDWRRHRGPKQECALCDKEVADLEKHIKAAHKDEAPRQPQTCEVCLQEFPCSNSLLRHYNLHRRRFVCKDCKNPFVEVDRATGSTERCHCPSCGKEVAYYSHKAPTDETKKSPEAGKTTEAGNSNPTEDTASTNQQENDGPSTSAAALEKEKAELGRRLRSARAARYARSSPNSQAAQLLQYMQTSRPSKPMQSIQLTPPTPQATRVTQAVQTSDVQGDAQDDGNQDPQEAEADVMEQDADAVNLPGLAQQLQQESGRAAQDGMVVFRERLEAYVPKYIQGQLVLCNNCGCVGADFNLCARCKNKITEVCTRMQDQSQKSTSNYLQFHEYRLITTSMVAKSKPKVKSSWELELFAAVQANDEPAAKRILTETFIQLKTAKGNSLTKSSFGREEWFWGVDSSLQYAASKGNDQMIELMVKAGINVNSVSVHEANRCTALHLAVRNNLGSTVKLLLNLKANKIQKATLNSLFGTPMEWAASLGNDEMIKLLIKSGDRINNKNMFNGAIYTALHLAVNENQVSSVKTLIDLGAKIGLFGTLHVPGTPLHLAASKGRNEIIKVLILAGADVNSTAFARCTPLHLAVFENNIATVSLLLEKGADATKTGELNGMSGTPLEWTRQKGRTEIARLLIAHELKGYPKVTIEDIKLMPTMEKSFSDALDAQEEIGTKRQAMSHIDQEVVNLQAQIGQLRDLITKQQEAKQRLAVEVSLIERGSSYKSEQEIEVLRDRLAKMKSVAASLKDVICPDGDATDKSCSVCFEVPKQVFSCVECDNWICGKCRARIEFCPSCRTSFATKPPHRNKTVERVFGIL